MLAIVQKDWTTLAPERQISMLKKLKPDMLCSFVRRLDPTELDISVLRWVAARQELDLGTALTLFFAFNPRRYNLLPRDAMDDDIRARCSVIDVLCQRINCGFYVPIASRRMDNPALVADWIKRQSEDREAGRRSRWVFDAAILSPMLVDKPASQRVGRGSTRPGLIQGLFTPLFVSNKS
jgi:hypothetical protein